MAAEWTKRICATFLRCTVKIPTDDLVVRDEESSEPENRPLSESRIRYGLILDETDIEMWRNFIAPP